MIQFPDEQTFAADLLQGSVQDFVSGGFHGDEGDVRFRHSGADALDHQLTLNHGQPAVPASDADGHGSSSNTWRMAFAARAVLW